MRDRQTRSRVAPKLILKKQLSLRCTRVVNATFFGPARFKLCSSANAALLLGDEQDGSRARGLIHDGAEALALARAVEKLLQVLHSTTGILSGPSSRTTVLAGVMPWSHLVTSTTVNFPLLVESPSVYSVTICSAFHHIMFASQPQKN